MYEALGQPSGARWSGRCARRASVTSPRGALTGRRRAVRRGHPAHGRPRGRVGCWRPRPCRQQLAPHREGDRVRSPLRSPPTSSSSCRSSPPWGEPPSRPAGRWGRRWAFWQRIAARDLSHSKRDRAPPRGWRSGNPGRWLRDRGYSLPDRAAHLARVARPVPGRRRDRHAALHALVCVETRMPPWT